MILSVLAKDKSARETQKKVNGAIDIEIKNIENEFFFPQKKHRQEVELHRAVLAWA